MIRGSHGQVATLAPRGFGYTKPSLGAVAAIDWSHPLAQGLVLCALLNELGGVRAYDIASGLVGDLENMTNGGTFLGARRGIGWTAVGGNGQTGRINFGSPSAIANIFASPGGTAIAWAYAIGNGFNSTEGARLFDKASGTTPGVDGWSMMHHNPNQRLHFAHDFATTRGEWRTSNSTALTHEVNMMAAAFDKDAGSPAPLLWVNGVPQSVTTVSSPAGSADDDSSQTLYTHSRHGNGADLSGGISLLMLYKGRILTDAEIAWLYQEPFAFLQPAFNLARMIPHLAAGTVHIGEAVAYGLSLSTALSVRRARGYATATGAGTGAARGTRVARGNATAAGVGSSAAVGRRLAIGRGTVVGSGQSSSRGARVASGTATATGAGSVVNLARRVAIGKGVAAGSSSAPARATRIARAMGEARGAATARAKASATFAGRAIAYGVSTVQSIGRGVRYGVGTAIGSASAFVDASAAVFQQLVAGVHEAFAARAREAKRRYIDEARVSQTKDGRRKRR